MAGRGPGKLDGTTPGRKALVTVWHPLIRLVHWGLVLGIAITWLTTTGPAKVHDAVGYAVLTLVALRCLWGAFGSGKARFGRFVRAPRATLEYAHALVRGREPRYVGHNPLGAWMIMALLLTAFGAAASGWLYTTDAYWGVAWVETLHSVLADLLLVLAAIHVGGVIVTSFRQHENLVAAMLHGRKRPPQGDDRP
ncbi:MAG TPA: cytochrome b/b6 domain-containing protein [Alphaproteobacteria bacterium]|nr:cytochrome b/b6 domain-containing protein [Alphaproteobacteria bacterium]